MRQALYSETRGQVAATKITIGRRPIVRRAPDEKLTPMTEAERERFMFRLNMAAHLETLRRALLSDDDFELEGLALEAIAIARMREAPDDIKAIRDVLQRVINKHGSVAYEPGGSGSRWPSGRLSRAKAVRLLHDVLSPAVNHARAHEGARADTLHSLATLAGEAVEVLRGYPKHFPGTGTEEAIGEAIVDAAIAIGDGPPDESLVGAALKAWGLKSAKVDAAKKDVKRLLEKRPVKNKT